MSLQRPLSTESVNQIISLSKDSPGSFVQPRNAVYKMRGCVLGNLRGKFGQTRRRQTAWTTELWIYDLRTNLHFTLKENPLKRADLDDLRRLLLREGPHEAEGERKLESVPPTKSCS